MLLHCILTLRVRQILNARISAHTTENYWNIAYCADIRLLVDAFFLYNCTFIDKFWRENNGYTFIYT